MKVHTSDVGKVILSSTFKNKFRMKILWKQEIHQRNENSRLGFIESVHVL